MSSPLRDTARCRCSPNAFRRPRPADGLARVDPHAGRGPPARLSSRDRAVTAGRRTRRAPSPSARPKAASPVCPASSIMTRRAFGQRCASSPTGHGEQRHHPQQQPLARHAGAQDGQQRGSDDDAQGETRHQQPGGGQGDTEVGGHLGQQPGDDDLRRADGEGAQGEGDQGATRCACGQRCASSQTGWTGQPRSWRPSIRTPGMPACLPASRGGSRHRELPSLRSPALIRPLWTLYSGGRSCRLPVSQTATTAPEPCTAHRPTRRVPRGSSCQPCAGCAARGSSPCSR
ncbi:hypothetical protein LX15_001108 [Streptoalloteichus tenebrarius]|uniref:Uncharacterized protein n=1 Tax=Streptoalloteichus tenebrarius (strain ATCC 17920 / DSM 40477 / JCM 4838 / CBS 697.72 / NBRC 16177 / NCIMB 11028 / NRRL B-12390 / A12253. 1 / ISP 5477) TaxID=1933 RepID=A0ABT1HPI6_STRSD|nr:hypothetical protein [Streptoalloteichus tenebrarius]